MRVSVGLSLAVFLKIATISKERISEIFAANNHKYTDFVSSALQLLQENIEGETVMMYKKNVSLTFFFITSEPFYLNEYDFVIVGSGPGGCVLANRLTENNNWKVLLIEAGKVETFMQNVPLLAINNQKTQYDWYFKSEPTNDACLGLVSI